MEDERQLVLFFSRGSEIDNVQLAAKLNSKFGLLGAPIVIPFNKAKPDQPLIIFNQGFVNLTVNATDISFIYPSSRHEEIYNSLIEIVEYFEYLDYSFERMGYISTFLHTKKECVQFKDKIFKDKNFINSEFNLSWYTKELIDSVSVNVWQRKLTDMINNVQLLSIYDINTPIDEPYNISSEFLSTFIKKCDKYVDNKEKEFF